MGSYEIEDLSRQINDSEKGGSPQAFDLRVQRQMEAMKVYGNDAQIQGVDPKVLEEAKKRMGLTGKPGDDKPGDDKPGDDKPPAEKDS